MNSMKDTMDGGETRVRTPLFVAPQPVDARGVPRSSPRIGGPLLLWMLGLALFPIRLIENVYDTSLPMLGLRPCNFSIGGSFHLFPQYGALFLFGVVLDIGRICVWMMLVSSFFTRSSSTRPLMATFLVLGVAHSVLPLVPPTASLKHHYVQCLTAVAMALWLPYVLLSQRVRRTFVHGSISRPSVRVAIATFVFLSIGLGAATIRSYLRFTPAAFAASPGSSRPTIVTGPQSTQESSPRDFTVAVTRSIR